MICCSWPCLWNRSMYRSHFVLDKSHGVFIIGSTMKVWLIRTMYTCCSMLHDSTAIGIVNVSKQSDTLEVFSEQYWRENQTLFDFKDRKAHYQLLKTGLFSSSLCRWLLVSREQVTNKGRLTSLVFHGCKWLSSSIDYGHISRRRTGRISLTSLTTFWNFFRKKETRQSQCPVREERVHLLTASKSVGSSESTASLITAEDASE